MVSMRYKFRNDYGLHYLEALGQAYDGLYSDMSVALGLHDGCYDSCAYLGWYDIFWHGEPNDETEYQKWAKDVWGKLGEEDNLEESLIYAESKQIEYGDPEDPQSPLNNYRLKGEGFLWEIYLRK